jgi:hypothetical protein
VANYTRHLNNVVETDADISFDLVVRDERDFQTYGGGRVTVSKPVTDSALIEAVNAAVSAIVAEGDWAFPKTAPLGLVDDSRLVARNLQEQVRTSNLEDRGPSLVTER